MTKEQILKAFEMKIDGYSMQYIANEFGCTKQNISEAFKTIIKEKGSTRLEKVVYPNLVAEIIATYKNEKVFCEIVGIDHKHLRKVITGIVKPSFDDIVKCCEHFNKDVLYLFKKKE